MDCNKTGKTMDTPLQSNDEQIHTITYYDAHGKIEHQQALNCENIADTIGMMIRCFLKSGEIKEGFADPYRLHGTPPYDHSIHDFIYLWTWANLDENTHRLVGTDDTKYDQTFIPVAIDSIVRIDAILHSNPRWGGRLVNHFFLDV